MLHPLPKQIPKATKPFVSNSSTTMSSKSSTSTYNPTIRNLPDIPNPVLMPIVPIKKSASGIPNKLFLAQAYRDKLNTLLLKCEVLNNTICFYQECIKKLELECVRSALRSGPVRFFCPFGFEPRPDQFFIFQKSMKNRTGPYRTGSLQFILVTEPVLTGFRPNPVRTGLYYIK